jgi:RNA polymerase sigma-70 factor (ECF subfamily)
VEELYRRHAEELRGYLYRRAGQAGADLLGEVFVVALRRVGDLPEPDLRRAWLFGTARRLLLAAGRDARQRHDAEAERARLHEPADDHADVDGSDRARAVNEALASLREADRELIRLTEWEQLQVAEAAVVLGLRPGTARVRLHRARRALAAHPALQGLLDAAPVSRDRAASATPRDPGPSARCRTG